MFAGLFVSCDKVMLVGELLAKSETVIVTKPPYSPDLAPADFFLLPKTKNTDERKTVLLQLGN